MQTSIKHFADKINGDTVYAVAIDVDGMHLDFKVSAKSIALANSEFYRRMSHGWCFHISCPYDGPHIIIHADPGAIRLAIIGKGGTLMSLPVREKHRADMLEFVLKIHRLMPRQ